MLTIVLKLLFVVAILKKVSGISCKDESGSDVPTWTIMKLPESTDYYYYDINNGYIFSENSLNDTSVGALTYTMTQLWNPNINYIIYNDEPPNQVTYNFSVAHSKGVWMWDDNNAIVITHSIPKFPQGPNLEGKYTGLMKNAWEYGQAATCFHLSLSSLEGALNLVYETVPFIYDRSSNSFVNNSNTNNIETTSDSCSTYVIDDKYIMFMKPSTYNVDIWGSCVSPYFYSNVFVESWIHGTREGPYCPPEYEYVTLDIQSLQFPKGQNFSEYNDHSKWGILQSPIVCFGDLNRVTSQMTRAGIVYCWEDSSLWGQLNQLIVLINYC
jgi:hypothetical protein